MSTHLTTSCATLSLLQRASNQWAVKSLDDRYLLSDAWGELLAEARLEADELVADTDAPNILSILKVLNARKRSATWKGSDWESFLRYFAITEANAQNAVQLRVTAKSWGLTVSWNSWLVPTVAGELSGILEGAPSAEEMAAIEARLAIERAGWKPSPNAWTLLEDLRPAVASYVRIQLWDSIMNHIEEEGPYPFRANCDEINTRADERGFTQAYLRLRNVKAEPTAQGYDPMSRLKPDGDGGYWLNLDRLYRIEALLSEPSG